MRDSLDAVPIRIWLFSLNRIVDSETIHVLSDDEWERARRFHKVVDRNRWVTSRFRLRTVLAEATGLQAAEITFGYRPTGKPFMQNAGVQCPEFNLTHSSDALLVAISQAAPVGIDIEPLRALADVESMANHALSASESERLMACNLTHRSQCFLEYWTQKEAVIKAFGKGLSNLKQLDLEAPEVRLPGGRRQRAGKNGWQVSPLELPDGYVGAVAVVGSEPRLEYVYAFDP